MSFTVKLFDGQLLPYPDSASYAFESRGVLAVRERCKGERSKFTYSYFAPLRWVEVIAHDAIHQPGMYRDRDKWLGGIGITTLVAYREQDDPEFVPDA